MPTINNTIYLIVHLLHTNKQLVAVCSKEACVVRHFQMEWNRDSCLQKAYWSIYETDGVDGSFVEKNIV